MDARLVTETHRALERLLKSDRGFRVFASPVHEQRDCAKDYYKIIKEPRWLRGIMADVRAGRLRSLQEVAASMETLVRNAQLYNPPPHDIHRLACKLRKEWVVRLKELQLLENNRDAGNVGDINDNRSNGSNSKKSTNVKDLIVQRPRGSPLSSLDTYAITTTAFGSYASIVLHDKGAIVLVQTTHVRGAKLEVAFQDHVLDALEDGHLVCWTQDGLRVMSPGVEHPKQQQMRGPKPMDPLQHLQTPQTLQTLQTLQPLEILAHYAAEELDRLTKEPTNMDDLVDLVMSDCMDTDCTMIDLTASEDDLSHGQTTSTNISEIDLTSDNDDVYESPLSQQQHELHDADDDADQVLLVAVLVSNQNVPSSSHKSNRMTSEEVRMAKEVTRIMTMMEPSLTK